MKIANVPTAVTDGNFPWVPACIETDKGMAGLVEAYWRAGVAELVDHAKPLLIGRNPSNINRPKFITERSRSLFRGRGSRVNYAAIPSLDTQSPIGKAALG